MRTLAVLFVIVWLGASSNGDEVPVGVTIHWNTIQNKFHADNQCMTWAADGHLYCTADDGRYITYQGDPSDPEWTRAWGWQTNLLRISDGPDFDDSDIRISPGFPRNYGAGRAHPGGHPSDAHYGYGALAVNDRIYSFMWLSDKNYQGVHREYHRPVANRLIYTRKTADEDYGDRFFLWDGREYTRELHADVTADTHFFYQEDPTEKSGRTAYAFNWLEFLQAGKNYGDAQDEFVYIYGPEQKDCRNLALMRVHKDRITERDAWRWFKGLAADGSPQWTANMDERRHTLRFPERDDNGKDWNVFS